MQTYWNDGVPNNNDVQSKGWWTVQSENKERLTQRFIAAVDFLNRQVHICGLDDWESLDMTIPQIKTLVLLERSGSLRMGNIASFLGRALSATTTVVDRLVEKELVDRAWDPSDRRVVICSLTDKGHQAMQRFWQIRRERLHVLAEFLDEEQLDAVVQGLELIRWADKEIQNSSIAKQSAR